ncbi:MAG: nucleotide exchange factor GrpE [Mollicutes bacterium]|nr:nucleotide exchange factor GrpE [Mollicutes bacterium]
MSEKVKKEVNKKPKKKNVELEKLINENKDLNEKVLRLNAELQNMNKRFSEEKANILKYDGEALIKDLLPVVDNFERAISLDDNDLTDELSKFLAGFKMIYTSLLDTLKNLGVKEIEAKGKEFDHNLMDAILTDHEEGIDPGIVLEVMQKGYMYNDKVIRHAMVKVNE